MKISILINPQNKRSSAIDQAYEFILASIDKEIEINQVFFYGYAVDFVFSQGAAVKSWQLLANTGIRLFACSSIADDLSLQNKRLNDGFNLAGLGQWTESIFATERHIEFA